MHLLSFACITPSVVSLFKSRHLPTPLIEIQSGRSLLLQNKPPVVLILKVACPIAKAFNQLEQSFIWVWFNHKTGIIAKNYILHTNPSSNGISFSRHELFSSTLVSLVENNSIRKRVGTRACCRHLKISNH